MCPPLSCCHGRSTSPLSIPLYHLLRLQLTSVHDLAPPERAKLPARLAACWEVLQATVQAHYRTDPGRARELTEQLLASLLLEACCRQALRQLVPLAEALGLAQTMKWEGFVAA